MKTKLIAAALLALGGISLGACASTTADPLSQEANDEIALQSLSTLSLVNNDTGVSVLRKALLSSDTSALTEEDISDIKAVLGQVDTILANKTGVTSTVIESTDETYAYGLEVTYTDIFSNASSYTLFYNYVTQEDQDLCDGEQNQNQNQFQYQNQTKEQNQYQSQGQGTYLYQDQNQYENQNGYRHGQGDNENGSRNNGTIVAKTYLAGILLSGEDTFNFTSTIKDMVKDDATETKVNFKLYGESGFYITAMQDYIIEDEATESRIRYTVFDGTEIVTSYFLRVEQSVEDNAEIRLTMDDQFYRITQIIDGDTEYLDVRYSNGEVDAHIYFEKVITIDPDTQVESVDFVIVE
ncbi:MAG: hypothetical protein WCS49_01615 [Bacilli bacterium]